MSNDQQIPGIKLKEGEKVEMTLKWHGIIYFNPINILIIPLIITWLKARNALMVITNQRIIRQEGLISKSQSKLDLMKIQDVNCEVHGLLSRIAGAGYVSVETAGRSSFAPFGPVSNYQAVVDKISDLMDEAKKREQMEMAQSIAAGMKGGNQQ